MQQRNLTGVIGRPVGTDGSDFSYRMVVESRYTKVAKGKLCLYQLIIAQVVIQFIGLLSLMLSVTKNKSINRLALASSVISAISFSMGGLGLNRSKVNLLKFFMIASSAAVLLSMAVLLRRDLIVEIIQDPSQWPMNKLLVVEIMGVVLGVLIQIFSVHTTISLVQNMSLKKAS